MTPKTSHALSYTQDQYDHLSWDERVAIKLPPFWPQQARVWFVQAEAQFVIKGVTADLTKYSYVTAALDQNTATRVLDILTDPPDSNKYDTLKSRLLDTYKLSEREAAARILDTNGLGDAKPSELLDRMLALVPTGKEPGFLLKEVFLRQLPADIQAIVTQQEYPSLRDLAKAADKHFLSTGCTINATFRNERPPRKAPSSVNKEEVCFYHKKFGDKATKCRDPCKFSENGTAGRR